MTRKPVVLLALFFALGACKSRESSKPPGPAAAAAEGAEPPPARQLRAWLDVFNTADPKKLTAAYPALFTDRQDVEQDIAFVGRTGGFDLRTIESVNDNRAVALLKERRGEQFARVEVTVEAAAAHRITSLHLRPVPTPDELRPARMTEPAAIEALRAELDRRVAADEFAGAIAIAKDGRPIFSQAYGMADREKKTPNTLETRFRIGSMNKMFTATATVQLAQAGKVRLDALLGAVLTDYPNKDVAGKVTLHHLLTHTGGTGDIFTPEYHARRNEIRTIADYIALFGNRGLAFEPTERWEYSNYGFILLGAVIEKVTGKTYYDAVQESVFGPAGMTSTSSPPEDQPMVGRSIPYRRSGPGSPWTSAADTLPYRGTSAGGGDSTVTDLLRFADALAGHRLLDAEHTALLTTGKVAVNDGDKYAYGFMDNTRGGVRCVGHGGGAPGMNGDLLLCDSGYTIAVLANLDPPAASRVSEFIRDRLPAK